MAAFYTKYLIASYTYTLRRTENFRMEQKICDGEKLIKRMKTIHHNQKMS